MKKVFTLLLLAGSLAFAGGSASNVQQPTTPPMTKSETVCVNNADKILETERSGCCSWHGGVADCGYNGRVICRDGTYSPSCTCAKPTVPMV